MLGAPEYLYIFFFFWHTEYKILTYSSVCIAAFDPTQTFAGTYFITRNLAVVHRVTANNRLLESNRFMRWRCPSVCLSVSRQNAYTKRDSLKKTKQFRAMFSIDDHALPHELFKEPIFGTPKFHDGGRPPSWKSLSRHILTKNYPILFKFGTQ